jgi:hypothetical protein
MAAVTSEPSATSATTGMIDSSKFSGPVDFTLGPFRVDVPGRHLQALLCGQDAGGLPDPAAGGSGGGTVAPGSVQVGQGSGADAVRLAARYAEHA